MSKLKRDVHAWAKRVRMSRARIWAVVEGSNYDIPFYEGLLSDGAGITPVELVRAEDLEVDGQSAGGKLHARKLWKALDRAGSLTQKNKETRVDIVFFLDRDDDEYLGKLINHDHVHYTHFADVEAEIIGHADLESALAKCFSISRADARSITPTDPLGRLATLWCEWIALRLASSECEWSDTRFAQPSKVNSPLYGTVDESRIDPICERVRNACADVWDEALAGARLHVAFALQDGSASQLVKGKWLAPYVMQLARDAAMPGRALPNVSASQFLTACLMSIDFSSTWPRYRDALAPLFAEHDVAA